MGQQRLTSLALMNIHQDIIIDVNDIIDRFSKKKKGNLILLFNQTNYKIFLLKTFLKSNKIYSHFN